MKIHTSKKNTPAQPPSQNEIAQRARQIWEAAGQPSGRDLDHWLQAEREIGLGPKNAAQTAAQTTDRYP